MIKQMKIVQASEVTPEQVASGDIASAFSDAELALEKMEKPVEGYRELFAPPVDQEKNL